LSAEKTPTLWGTLPAFEALITKLRQHQRSQTIHIASFEIVEYGIEKLEEYE